MDRVRDAHLEPDQGTSSTGSSEGSSGYHTCSRDRFLAMVGGAGTALVGGGIGSALAERAGSHVVPAPRSSAAAAASQTLTLAVFQDPDTLDPAASGLITSGQIAAHVFDPLIWHLPTPQGSLKYYPGLAQSFQVSPDATTYTFKLRKDVTFHDSSPFSTNEVFGSTQDAGQPSEAAQPGER